VIEEALISDKEELKAEAMQEFRNLGVEILSID